MSAITNPKLLVPAGIVACILSFPILFIGALSTGGGHGSYWLWYIAIIYASLAAAFLLFGTSVALKKRKKRESIFGAIVLLLIGVLALRFWDIAEWVAKQLFE